MSGPLPAWLDAAVAGGHTMTPDVADAQDSRRWTCSTCGAVAVPPDRWGMPSGALAYGCGVYGQPTLRDRAWEMFADELADQHMAAAQAADQRADLRAEHERYGR